MHGRSAASAGTRHQPVRRRGGGRPARRGVAAMRKRATEAALQPYEGLARACQSQPTPMLPLDQIRRIAGSATSVDARARLSVPVLVLHHHQRAGPQEPLPVAPTISSRSSAECRAGHPSVLHHRRQFRAQQNWEAILRPADLAAGEGGPEDQLHHPGRHAVPQDRPNFIDKAKRAGVTRVFIGLENINPDSLIGAKKRQNKHHRLPQDAAGLEAGRRASPMPATFSASPTTRRRPSGATSRSSSASCRSIILEFFILTPLAGIGGPQGAL